MTYSQISLTFIWVLILIKYELLWYAYNYDLLPNILVLILIKKWWLTPRSPWPASKSWSWYNKINILWYAYNDDLLPDLLDLLLDLGLCAGPPLQLLDSQPEPQVLMAVLFLHEGQQLLENRENSWTTSDWTAEQPVIEQLNNQPL